MKYFRDKIIAKSIVCEDCKKQLTNFIFYNFMRLCENCFFLKLLEEELDDNKNVSVFIS